MDYRCKDTADLSFSKVMRKHPEIVLLAVKKQRTPCKLRKELADELICNQAFAVYFVIL